MSRRFPGLPAYLKPFMEEDSDSLVPVKACFLERRMTRTARCDRLHPNPDDEFTDPSIGPNYSIISDYAGNLSSFGSFRPGNSDDPIIVEKVHPDGYMILNGHHRWAAALKVGLPTVPISIVNLTQETDIEQMVRRSRHDRRVTLDLDEVVFCKDEEMPAEKPLSFPFNRFYTEKIRLGIPALLHFLAKQGYDIWLYSAEYYSFDYIQDYFRHYTVKLDGIVTGTARKTKHNDESQERTRQLVETKYAETLHIDRDIVLLTRRDSRDFEEYSLNADPAEWSRAATALVREMNKNEKK